ncbi:MAG: patatin-like phospholipase family protein [Candidatus Doudnabacteria bacterium]|jgi:predicted acylesterase/phospholipase RssA
MENLNNHRKVGLALSGSGNRSAFYIGFLEYLSEQNIKVDYITACSGGSLVAAAYACGTLPEFKKLIFSLTPESLKNYMKRTNGGGFYSIDLLEEAIRTFTKGLNFEEVRPLMGFVAVDIENGEKVLLCMGDIARAARISCTLPGIFEPVQWGGKTLIDGGLLTMVPGDFLKQAGMDVTIGVNMRGTKHIFTENQISAKKFFNLLKKIFLIDNLENILNNIFTDESEGLKKPRMFEVIGKSLDLAIEANKKKSNAEEDCDLMIYPEIPKFKKNEFSPETNLYFYQRGREVAIENLDKIKKLINQKK